jgi:hypothetical protein
MRRKLVEMSNASGDWASDGDGDILADLAEIVKLCKEPKDPPTYVVTVEELRLLARLAPDDQTLKEALAWAEQELRKLALAKP